MFGLNFSKLIVIFTNILFLKNFCCLLLFLNRIGYHHCTKKCEKITLCSFKSSILENLIFVLQSFYLNRRWWWLLCHNQHHCQNHNRRYNICGNRSNKKTNKKKLQTSLSSNLFLHKDAGESKKNVGVNIIITCMDTFDWVEWQIYHKRAFHWKAPLVCKQHFPFQIIICLLIL